MSEGYPGGWFGESWGAPACDPTRHKPTPVGDLCEECAGVITADDSGMLIPFVSTLVEPAVLAAYHLPCFLSMILPRRGRG